MLRVRPVDSRTVSGVHLHLPVGCVSRAMYAMETTAVYQTRWCWTALVMPEK